MFWVNTHRATQLKPNGLTSREPIPTIRVKSEPALSAFPRAPHPEGSGPSPKVVIGGRTLSRIVGDPAPTRATRAMTVRHAFADMAALPSQRK